MTTLSFTDTPMSLAELRSALARYNDSGRLTQGSYWEEGLDDRFEGNLIGCLFHEYKRWDEEWSETAEKMTGVPAIIWAVANRLFEQNDECYAVEFAGQFANTLERGVDYWPAWHDFAKQLLDDVQFGSKWWGGIRACEPLDRIIDLHQRAKSGQAAPSEMEWLIAANTAIGTVTKLDHPYQSWPARRVAAATARVSAAPRGMTMEKLALLSLGYGYDASAKAGPFLGALLDARP